MILIGMGAAAGIMGGLLGIGGAILIVPSYVFFLNFDQHRAHGTSLVSAFLLALSGITTYSLAGVIEWRVYWPVALEMTAGGVTGAMFGARVAKATHAAHLRRVFSLLMVVGGARMIWGAWHACSGQENLTHFAFMNGAFTAGAMIVGLGLVTGFLSALLGVGGGIVMVPSLVILLCVKQQVAQAISLAAMIPTAFTGMLMHRAMGNVDLKVGLCVGAGAMVGAIAGARAAASLPSTTLQMVFGVFLFLIAGLMALKKNGDKEIEG